jgi:hypothetical protein
MQTLKALVARRRNLALLLAAALMLATAAVAIGDPPHQRDSNAAFKLFGNASDAQDPQNADNDVVKFDTTDPNTPDGMFRNVNETVSQVTDQVELKYFFHNRDCQAGSPRIDLFVDTNGDGKADGTLNGYIQPQGGCQQDKWVFDDLANLNDSTPHWGSIGLPGGPGSGYEPWSAVVATFGNDDVVGGQLVDDSQSFSTADQGIAYYDLVSIGNRTFTSHEDTAGQK